MSPNGEGGDNIIGVRTVYEAVLRLEGTIGALEQRLVGRVDSVDTRVDTVMLKQERLEGRLEGSLGMIKWLGPAGVAAIVVGIAKTVGLL